MEIRQQVWQVAQDAARFGIVTIGGALVFAQIHWELGIDCLNHMAGLKNVADDPGLNENAKIEQLWAVRCAIFDALASS